MPAGPASGSALPTPEQEVSVPGTGEAPAPADPLLLPAAADKAPPAPAPVGPAGPQMDAPVPGQPAQPPASPLSPQDGPAEPVTAGSSGNVSAVGSGGQEGVATGGVSGSPPGTPGSGVDPQPSDGGSQPQGSVPAVAAASMLQGTGDSRGAGALRATTPWWSPAPGTTSTHWRQLVHRHACHAPILTVLRGMDLAHCQQVHVLQLATSALVLADEIALRLSWWAGTCWLCFHTGNPT